MTKQGTMALMAGFGILMGLSVGGAYAQSPAPTARWTFDEGTGTTAADVSGTNPATLEGNTGWTAGLVGTHCLLLSGQTDSFADIPKPALDTTQSYTVMAWVKVSRASGYQTIVSIDGQQISGFFLQFRDDTKDFAFTVPPGDGTSGDTTLASSSVGPQPNVWYHLAGVYNAAEQTVSLYVNGSLQETIPFKTPWRAMGHTVIGRGKYGGKPVDFVNGDIDDVRLYQAALSAPDIRAIAQANLPPGTVTGPPPPATLTINAGQSGPRLNPLMYGLMTEEINYSYDGGLYGELIQNRAFHDDPTKPVHWSLVSDGGGSGAISLDPLVPLNDILTTSLKLDASGAGSGKRVGAANDEFWGIPIKPNTRYQVSFYAKAAPGFTGPLTVDIESSDGQTVYAKAQVSGITGTWRQYTATLTTGKDAPATTAARFVVSTERAGMVWLDLVSLFPPTYHNRSNGNRIDLMQKLAALNPAFLRLPGGNYLEGDTIATRFDWKKTLGPLENRPGHEGPWNYRSSDGMGLLEYLEWCEDLKMEPVLAVYAGYSLNRYKNPNPERVAPGPALAPYVQDALDEIEYVTGGSNTTWGGQRVQDGHPSPFPLHYVEIGNEDGFDESGSYDARYAQFYDAIKAKYPQLQLIATAGGKDSIGARQKMTIRRPDLIDEHYYESPREFEDDTHHYDTYDRTGPKIFVGEWASQMGSFSAKGGESTPNLDCALGDAAWMTGMERNSDVVVLESYAPLFVNINPGGRQWKTNLIGYDALNSYGSPSYYVQVLFDRYHGDTVIPATLAGPPRLAQSVTRNSTTGAITVKLVNPSAYPQPLHVTLTGLTAIAPTGLAVTLSGSSLSDTNTITEPTKIAPMISQLNIPGPSFDYRLAPYSITVLQLRAKP